MSDPVERVTASPAVAIGRWLLIGVVTFYVGILLILPIGAMVASVIAQGGSAFAATFGNPDVQAALILSLRVSVITIIVNGIFGFIVAWALVRARFPGWRIINALVDLPFALSPVVAGYIFILMFGRLSPLAGIEDALGVSFVFSEPGIIIATLFVTLPLMIREMIPVIATLDKDHEHAAATLGASRWQTFYLVTFPAIRSGLLYGLSLTFARALGEFGAVLVVGGGIQGSTETAPLFIYRALEERNTGAAYWVALGLGIFSLALVVGTDQLRKRLEA
jgi:sulfate/thiosulfate transport system permease protein